MAGGNSKTDTKSKSVVIFFPIPKNSVDREFFESYILMKNYLLAHAHLLPFRLSGVYEYFAHTFPIDACRNECAVQVAETGYDISIWLDTDQTFTPEAIFRLLSHPYPIVAGMYFAKAEPFHPIVFLENGDSGFRLFNSIVDYPREDLFYADMIGMGCVRIDKEVIDKLENPYFKYQSHPEGSVAQDAEFRIKHRIGDVSEDVYFWQQVKQAGYRIVVDPLVQCGHIARISVDNRAFWGYVNAQKEAYIAEHGKEKFEKIWEKQCRPERVKKKNSGTMSKSTQPAQISNG